VAELGETHGAPRQGIEGLEFENGFVSIPTDEWFERFPLVMSPDGRGESWDYGDNASELLLDQQDPACIWTHMEADDGTGTLTISGRFRVNRLGYYISTIPVPEGLTIQAWDDPWSKEDERVVREAIGDWQREVEVPSDIVAWEEFEEWFYANHRGWQLDAEGAALVSSRMPEFYIYDSLDDYRDEQ
jgi:hypothetical protein